VVLSVPWDVIPEALEQAGDLSCRVVIDTTNQFGSGSVDDREADRVTGRRVHV
jgi:predicted dinucleotide-binding enzyme